MSMSSAPPSGWFKNSTSSQEETMERATMELADDLKHQFSDRDLLYADIDSVLFGELPVDIPEAYRKTAIEVRSPLALHIATTVTAALSVNPMSTVFKPVGFGDTYQQNSTLRENFFEASWKRQEQEAKRQLLRLFLWSMAVKGEGIIKTVERSRSAWSEYSDKSLTLEQQLQQIKEYDQDARDRVYHHETENYKLALPYPIASTDVPPETFYYTKNENGFTSVVEIKELPYIEALERFGAGLNSNGEVISPSEMEGFDPRAAELARAEWRNLMRGPSSGGHTEQTIRCVEAWDYQHQVICLSGPGQRDRGSNTQVGQGTLCRVLKHSYGDPLLKTLKGPYFHALGITTASRLPEHAGLSILFGFLRLFPLLDSLLTMQGNAAYMTGFPAFKKTTPPGVIPGLPAMPYGVDAREQNTDAQTIEPGKLFPFDISPIDQPRSGVDADKLIDNIKSMLEWALPSVVQGVVASDQSGYALNQAAYLARLGWDPIVSNAEVALGDRIGFESWLIENRIGEKVYAWGEVEAKKGKKQIGGQTKAAWLGIGPDDLKGVHRYEAKLAPSTPSNEIIETRAIGEKMQLKLITYEDAVERAGANPDEVEKSWILHDLKNSQEIQQELKNSILQKIGTIRSARMAAAGVPPGMLPPPGASAGPPPGMPPNGPPPPGMPGPATTGVPGGTPGAPPAPGPGGMPPNPVPSPGMGLPPPGNPPGTPVVPMPRAPLQPGG
jgi:hypothetical protein